jgi:DNA-binding GntR family transcriptional regulator
MVVSTNVKVSKLVRAPALKERAYRSLKHTILYDLSGGDSVVIEELAAQLGISRTPVREALLALEREGLVVSIPNRGTFVAIPGAEEVREIYQVRGALESLAAKLATPLIPDEELENLRIDFDSAQKGIEAGDFNLYLQCDTKLHKLIFQYAGNEVLTQFIENLEDRVYRIRINARRRATQHLIQAHKEHRAVLDALIERDAEEAELQMKTHLKKDAKRLADILTSTDTKKKLDSQIV